MLMLPGNCFAMIERITGNCFAMVERTSAFSKAALQGCSAHVMPDSAEVLGDKHILLHYSHGEPCGGFAMKSTLPMARICCND